MLAENNLVLAQQEVDRLMHTLRDPAATTCRRASTRSRCRWWCPRCGVPAADGSAGGLSAAEVASASGSSRVTARRYLEYLVTSGVAVRSARYRSAGRPEVEYRLVPRERARPPGLN